MAIPNNKVKIIFCNVGQGDAAIVTSGYSQMLIDVGPKNGGIDKCLGDNLPLGDKNIELVVLSHMDSDHSGALQSLKEKYNIKKVMGLGDLFYRDEIIGNGYRFKVLFPDVGLQPRDNDSIVGELFFEDKRILFTGDIDSVVENGVVGRVQLPVDVLKLSHHGSNTGNSVEWLQKINARLAIVSVGKNNYGHPSQLVLGNVLGIGTSVVRTDKNGSLLLE